MTTAEIRAALTEAFNRHTSILGSYLDAVDFTAYAWLTLAWEDRGAGTDSLLSFAEKIRKGKFRG